MSPPVNDVIRQCTIPELVWPKGIKGIENRDP